MNEVVILVSNDFLEKAFHGVLDDGKILISKVKEGVKKCIT